MPSFFTSSVDKSNSFSVGQNKDDYSLPSLPSLKKLPSKSRESK